MYGPGRRLGGGSGRRAPFTGGIWAGTNPFSGGSGGGFGEISSRNGPVRGGFDYGYDDGLHEDWGSQGHARNGMDGHRESHGSTGHARSGTDDHREGCRSTGHHEPRRNGMGSSDRNHERRSERRPETMDGSGDPRGHGNTVFYSTVRDSNGNVRERGYGPQGPFRNITRGGRRMDDDDLMDIMGGMETLLDGVFGGHAHSSRRPRTSGGAFSTPFWTGGNPFGAPGFDDRPIDGTGLDGRGGTRERGIQPNGRFAFEMEPARDRPDTGPSEFSHDRDVWFLDRHTEPLTAANTTEQTNEECSICMEKADAHPCVKIKDVEGCVHMIGKTCLRELLKRNPDDKKECPLCRALWLPENGIWQDSQEWQDRADVEYHMNALRGGAYGHHDSRRPRRSHSHSSRQSHAHGPRMGSERHHRRDRPREYFTLGRY